MQRALLVLALVAGLAAAIAPSAGNAAGAVLRSAVRSGDTPLDVVLALSGRKERELAAYVRAVSDPGSPRYRRYLTLKQLAERFGAPKRHQQAVLSYLREHGLEGRVDPSATLVSVTMPASTAAELFSTRLVRTAPVAGRTALRPARQPAIPDALAGAVAGVVGLDTRPLVRSHLDAGTPAPATFGEQASGMQRSGTPAGCAEGQSSHSPLGIPGFTPNQWLTAYGVGRLHARGLTGRGQRLGLIEIDGYLESDLEAAGACFGYEPPPLRRILAGIDEPLAPGGETTLDLQVISATAPGLDEIQIYQGDATLAGLILTFLAPLEQPAGERPDVVSASLGACEPGYSGSAAALDANEQLFRVMAALGMTVVASAGDTGSSGCALAGNSSALGVLATDYPASSAYVTGVGGTNVALDAANGIVDEIVWNDNPVTLASGETIFGGAGGGGQSLVVDRPWWQRSPTVTGPKRLVPDVAFLADIAPGYAIYCSVPGEKLCEPVGFVSVGGTSTAAPLLAASVALANEEAAKRGQPRLGFLNPLLYRIGASANVVYDDVVQGSNDVGAFLPEAAGGGRPFGCCGAGVGWDRASGWGSLDVAAFENAARAAYAERPRGRR